MANHPNANPTTPSAEASPFLFEPVDLAQPTNDSAIPCGVGCFCGGFCGNCVACVAVSPGELSGPVESVSGATGD